MTELRREAGPFRIVATGVTEVQLDAFVALALRAWGLIPAEIGTTIENDWPTDWPDFLPRVIEIQADDSIRIPGIRWSRQQILCSVPAGKCATAATAASPTSSRIFSPRASASPTACSPRGWPCTCRRCSTSRPAIAATRPTARTCTTGRAA
jgi:hypothetical protein